MKKLIIFITFCLFALSSCSLNKKPAQLDNSIKVTTEQKDVTNFNYSDGELIIKVEDGPKL